MKKLLILLTILSANVFADEGLAKADVTFVKETYDYCVSLQEEEGDEKVDLLNCINSELEYYEYQKFDSLASVKKFINSNGSDEF